MTIGTRIENPQAALPPGPGTLSIIEKEYTGGAQSITSTSPTLIVGTSQVFALAGAQDVMFTGFASANPSVTLEANVGFGINIDGVDYYGTIIGTLNLGGNVQGGLFVSKGLSLGAGNHTVYLFAYRLSAARTPGSIISGASQPTRWEAIFGGGADTPNEPVVGGSGTQYLTIADAIAGETETRVAGVVPQAGTVPGVVVGPGTLSAVDDFYKDWFVVNTDTTPSSGLASQWARVASYVGATRTMTLDKPWDFSAESDLLLVDPARLTLKQDVTEDVTVNKCVVMDLGGNRVKGKVDVTAAELCWIRGSNGYVTNGVQKVDFGLLKIDDCSISRRNATIYALLLTSGSNVGRCEIVNCPIAGVFAARRGYMGWLIQNCTDYGLSDGVNNVPARLVESIAGVAVVMSALDVSIDGPFAGAVVYSENSITGTPYVSVLADVSLPLFPNGQVLFTTTRPTITMWEAVAAGVITVTLSTTPASMQAFNIGVSTGESGVAQPYKWSYVAAQNLTGSISLTLTGTFFDVNMETAAGAGNSIAVVDIFGASTMSGSITLTGGTLKASSPQNSLIGVRIASPMTGSVSMSTAQNANGFIRTYSAMRFSAPQTSGTPSVTVSGLMQIEGGVNSTLYLFDPSLATSISVGTWTVSGAFEGQLYGPVDFAAINANVSGGTWNVSGVISYLIGDRTPTAGGSLALHGGTGGTLTVSSSAVNIAAFFHGQYTISAAIANGATAVVSGIVSIAEMKMSGGFFVTLANANGATANMTGSVILKNIRTEASSVFLNANIAGANSTGPTSITLEGCVFATTGLTFQGTAGTVTWANATVTFKLCQIDVLMTVVGTSLTSLQAFHSRFNGNSSNKSITITGTRPATFRFWKCSFAARFDDLQPEVLDVYDILPAQAALVQGQPVKVNAANQYQVCVAASIVDGVALAAAGGAGTILIAVRQGRIYVTCKAGTVNGDNLVLDLATPTQANQGAFLAGQEIGTALENVGAVVAGKCYTALNVR